MEIELIITLCIIGGVFYTAIFTAIETMVVTSLTVSDIPLMIPNVLREITEMNKFGCWCTAIFIRLLNPIASIVYFIYWIFHI